MKCIKKKILSLFVIAQLSCLASTAMGIRTIAKEKDDETLVTGKTTFGGFFGPVVKISELNDEFATLVGGRAGLIINHAFVIGGAGYGLANEIDVYSPRHELLDFGYGGLFLGYVNHSRRLVHLSVHTLIGGGGLRYRTRYYDNWHDALFVFEPGMEMVLNVTKHFRIGLGGSYRFVSDVDLEGLNNKAMSGPSASVIFKFGKF